MLRFLTAGESHGPALVVIIEGVPAGLTLSANDIHPDLARRQLGYGRGRRMAIEHDQVEILSGIRRGETLGSPVAFVIRNRDWANWQHTMSIEADPPESAGGARRAPVTRPRPGHADLAGGLKYGREDLRDVLERASAEGDEFVLELTKDELAQLDHYDTAAYAPPPYGWLVPAESAYGAEAFLFPLTQEPQRKTNAAAPIRSQSVSRALSPSTSRNGVMVTL